MKWTRAHCGFVHTSPNMQRAYGPKLRCKGWAKYFPSRPSSRIYIDDYLVGFCPSRLMMRNGRLEDCWLPLHLCAFSAMRRNVGFGLTPKDLLQTAQWDSTRDGSRETTIK